MGRRLASSVRGSWRVWSIVVLLVFAHFLLHLGFGLEREAPDLLVVALLVGAREVKLAPGAALGFAFGILEDAFSALAFGASTIAMTVTGAAGARTQDLFVGDSLLFLVSYLFLGKWMRDLIFWVAVGENLRGPFDDVMLVQASLASAYAALVGVAVLKATGAWWRDAR